MEDFAKAASMARQMKPFLRALGNAEEVINTAKGAQDSISSLNTEMETLTPKVTKLRKSASDWKKKAEEAEERFNKADSDLKSALKGVDKAVEERRKSLETELADYMASLEKRKTDAEQEKNDILSAIDSEISEKQKLLDSIRRSLANLQGKLSA